MNREKKRFWIGFDGFDSFGYNFDTREEADAYFEKHRIELIKYCDHCVEIYDRGEKKMNVNEINLDRTTRVESDTDAYHIVSNQFQLDGYIAQFGNVEVVYDAESKVYRVPSLDEKRNLYCEKKTLDCAKWGCE